MPRGNIFLNYRRDDTAGHAGRLFDRLNQRFPGRIFRDVTGIAYGLDFVEEIERKLASCQVLIVLIGKYWLTLTDEEGRRRLDDENDFVRLEVATGLRRNIRVIPVLVSGARMPRAAELPEDLQRLAKRNALEVTEPDFDNDAARLIRALEEALGEQPLRVEPEPHTPPPRKTSRAGLLVALVAAVLVGMVVVVLALNRTPETKAGGSTQSPFYLTPGGPTSTPTPQPLSAAGEKKQPLPSDPAPTQAAKPTPAVVPDVKATPSPTNSGSVKKYFDPVGNWRVIGQSSALDGILVCRADGSFHAEGIYQRERVTSDGSWRYYGSNPLVLLFEVPGDDTYSMQIRGYNGDSYYAYHSFYGDLILKRIAQ